MPVPNRIADFAPDMAEWRQDLHRHPELGFEETRTSGIVAAKLAEWGIEVHRGLAGTGVVGVADDFEKFISSRKSVPPPEGYLSKPIDVEKFLGLVDELTG